MRHAKKSPALWEQQPGLKGFFVRASDSVIINAVLPVVQVAVEGIALGLVLTLPVYLLIGGLA